MLLNINIDFNENFAKINPIVLCICVVNSAMFIIRTHSIKIIRIVEIINIYIVNKYKNIRFYF